MHPMRSDLNKDVKYIIPVTSNRYRIEMSYKSHKKSLMAVSAIFLTTASFRPSGYKTNSYLFSKIMDKGNIVFAMRATKRYIRDLYGHGYSFNDIPWLS
jgi:hypothetical protein